MLFNLVTPFEAAGGTGGGGVSAPAAPAAPAPSPAPAPAPSAPPAAPAPAPAPEAPAPGPGPAPVPPAAPPAAPAGPPKADDFAQTEDGIADFIEANERWKQEHPDEADQAAEQARKDADARKPGAQQPDDEAPKPAEPKPDDQPGDKQPVAAATPKVLDDLFQSKPALKAAFDADPEAKEILMETARQAAAAQPVLDLVGTVEEARFAVETTSSFLNMKHGFAMAGENPEAGDRAFQALLNEFTLRDEKGAPVMKDGQPVMAESFDFLTQRLTTGAVSGTAELAKREIEQLGFKVDEKGNLTPIDPSKEVNRDAAAEAGYKYAALKFVAELLAQDTEASSLPELPADATPAQREFQEKLKAQQAELDQNKGKGKKAERVAARLKYENEVNGAFGTGVGEYVENTIKTLRERGEVIPDFVLEEKWINPTTQQETNYPAFAVRIMNKFTEKINKIPSVATKLQQLELMGPPARQQRLDYFAQLRKDHLGKIVDAEIKRIQDGIRGMSAAKTTHRQEIAKVARVEPSASGTTAPATGGALSGEALAAKVRENLQANPEYIAGDRVDRAEMEMLEAERLRSGR